MLVGLFLYKKVICFPTQLQWVTGTGMLLMEVRRDTLVLWGVGHGGGRSCYGTVGVEHGGGGRCYGTVGVGHGGGGRCYGTVGE